MKTDIREIYEAFVNRFSAFSDDYVEFEANDDKMNITLFDSISPEVIHVNITRPNGTNAGWRRKNKSNVSYPFTIDITFREGDTYAHSVDIDIFSKYGHFGETTLEINYDDSSVEYTQELDNKVTGSFTNAIMRDLETVRCIIAEIAFEE